MIRQGFIATKSDFESATGWELKAEGLCRGGVCVPFQPKSGEFIDFRQAAPLLGMAIVHDEPSGAIAIGPATLRGRALDSANARDFSLADFRGEDFSLSSLRGRKVLLIAWASW